MNLKLFIKKLIPKFLIGLRGEHLKKKQILEWRKQGSQLPPPHIVKQAVIKEFQKKYEIKTLIETGTYRGDMVYAQLHNFKNIISIELSNQLFEAAKTRFEKIKKIKIIQGDSGYILSELITKMDSQALFWLDGHYSGGETARGETDCPIFEELKAIFSNNKKHILLIDDARLFNGSNHYPTIDEVKKYILANDPLYNVNVKDDIIRAYIP